MLRHRVFTYITRKNDLLVFDHVDQRYLNPQIPGGTIENGEKPENAALREAEEETGLKKLVLKSLLGNFEADLNAIGRNETIHAWFFHLTTSESTPDKWCHSEEHPSEGSEPIEFELYWVPIASAPKLGRLDNTMISRLLVS